jgi:hypothetical protein
MVVVSLADKHLCGLRWCTRWGAFFLPSFLLFWSALSTEVSSARRASGGSLPRRPKPYHDHDHDHDDEPCPVQDLSPQAATWNSTTPPPPRFTSQ